MDGLPILVTPIEEAKYFAEYIMVTDPDNEGKEITFNKRVEKWVMREQSPPSIPHETSKEVIALANELHQLEKYTASLIRIRLELLVLPTKVQNMIENDDLNIKTALEIARLRAVPDAHKQMEMFAEQHKGSVQYNTMYGFMRITRCYPHCKSRLRHANLKLILWVESMGVRQ